MKYIWINGHRKEFEFVKLCDALAVSANGYRCQELKRAYGSLRMVREPRDRGFPASEERVERLMREDGIRARRKRRFKATTDSKHALRVAPNLRGRDLTPAKPNQVWTADMTYIWTDEDWLYLAVVLDLFNREVVGWSIKTRMTADIVIDALTMAWFRKKPALVLSHQTGEASMAATPSGRGWKSTEWFAR